jgi:hypothetical protein
MIIAMELITTIVSTKKRFDGPYSIADEKKTIIKNASSLNFCHSKRFFYISMLPFSTNFAKDH